MYPLCGSITVAPSNVSPDELDSITGMNSDNSFACNTINM
jgi:hypothetical protein